MKQFIDEEHLMKLLTRLKLTSLKENLDNLLDEASKEGLSYRELVYLLCREEVRQKTNKYGYVDSALSMREDIRWI
ncbi:hypothetical protein FACS1894187_18240 [Synergistales bacterium]|nr:hypothetical protein FACS1894187_18240 [Synergistales bacterium]